jgi:hypothetical protein
MRERHSFTSLHVVKRLFSRILRNSSAAAAWLRGRTIFFSAGADDVRIHLEGAAAAMMRREPRKTVKKGHCNR